MATATKSSNARKSSSKASKTPKTKVTTPETITSVIKDLAKEEAKVETPKSSSRKSKRSGAKAKPEVKTEPKVDTHSGTSEKEESRIHDAVVTLVNKFGDKLSSMYPATLVTVCSALKIRAEDLTPVRLNRAASELREKREKWEEKVKEENKNGKVKTVLNGKLPGETTEVSPKASMGKASLVAGTVPAKSSTTTPVGKVSHGEVSIKSRYCDVLKAIAELEGKNGVWEKDLKEYLKKYGFPKESEVGGITYSLRNKHNLIKIVHQDKSEKGYPNTFKLTDEGKKFLKS